MKNEKPAKSESISINEFSKRMGIAYSTARRCVLRGRVSSTGTGREIRISWPAARDEFYKKRDESKIPKNKPRKKKATKASNENADEYNKFDSQAKKEFFLAKLRELEFLEKSGQLVDGQLIGDKLFERSRQVRDALLNIPDRISSILFAEVLKVLVEANFDESVTKKVKSELNAARCYDIILHEIERVIEDLTRSWKL